MFRQIRTCLFSLCLCVCLSVSLWMSGWNVRLCARWQTLYPSASFQAWVCGFHFKLHKCAMTLKQRQHEISKHLHIRIWVCARILCRKPFVYLTHEASTLEESQKIWIMNRDMRAVWRATGKSQDGSRYGSSMGPALFTWPYLLEWMCAVSTR